MNTLHNLSCLFIGLLLTAALSLGCSDKHKSPVDPVDPTPQPAVRTVAVPATTVAAGTPVVWVGGADANFAGNGVITGAAYVTVSRTAVALYYWLDELERRSNFTHGRYPPAAGSWAKVVLYSAPAGWSITASSIVSGNSAFGPLAAPGRQTYDLYSASGPASLLSATCETRDGADMGVPGGALVVGLDVREFEITLTQQN